MNAAPTPVPAPDDEQPQELTSEQQASVKARLRELFGEPPVEMIRLAIQREQQFEEARAAAQ
ncbi:hypothetical protein ABZ897_16185 [Nonomuraea sp. NPDC046802]|uniref:hypothetical protein n=1 Tax=Nonomuraea sp. NPDC046802 TaxID=3154919 RepID=UPI003408E876